MHHGHMLVAESELRELREASFPLCLVENGVCFGKTDYVLHVENSDLENLLSFQIFAEFFERRMIALENVHDAFDVLWRCSSATLVPILFLQSINGKSLWKKDALMAVKEFLTSEENELLNYLRELRNNFGELFNHHSSIDWNSDDTANPGLITKERRELTRVDPEILQKLGMTDKRMQQASLMWQRLSRISLKQFCEKHVSNNIPRVTVFGLLNTNSFSELPRKTSKESYRDAQELFLDRALSNENVEAIYGLGEIACPGLSDLDFIVGLKSNVSGIPASLQGEIISA